MSSTPEQIKRHVQATIHTLKKLSAKERMQKPSQPFIEDYNNFLSMAKEAMPSIDSRC
jgi:hypothetical protein